VYYLDILSILSTMPTTKIVLVGNSRVGKSSFVERLHGAFHSSYAPTLGSEVFPLTRKGKRSNLWDLGCSPALAGPGDMYFVEADVAAVFFSLVDSASFSAARGWSERVREVSPGAQVALVGTHLDAPRRTVSEEDISALSADIGASVFLISSATGEGVEKLAAAFAAM